MAEFRQSCFPIYRLASLYNVSTALSGTTAHLLFSLVALLGGGDPPLQQRIADDDGQQRVDH